MTIADTFHTIAEQTNYNRSANYQRKLKEYVSKKIVPALRKRAKTGAYSGLIKKPRRYAAKELMTELDKYGFVVIKTENGCIKVRW